MDNEPSDPTLKSLANILEQMRREVDEHTDRHGQSQTDLYVVTAQVLDEASEPTTEYLLTVGKPGARLPDLNSIEVVDKPVLSDDIAQQELIKLLEHYRSMVQQQLAEITHGSHVRAGALVVYSGCPIGPVCMKCPRNKDDESKENVIVTYQKTPSGQCVAICGQSC